MDPATDLMQLITSEEPLHPDLVPYMDEDGLCLRHPLVYEIFGVRPGLANFNYKKKKEALAEAIKQRNWHRSVFLYERPWRADALILLEFAHADDIDDETYWKLVGSVWIDSENVWQNRDEWEELFGSLRPGREAMMTSDEAAVLSAMSDPVTVYRGAIAGLNDEGLSWTTDRAVARFFAKRFAGIRGEGRPVVDVGQVVKDNIIAYLTGRNENEIVIMDHAAVKIVRRELP